MKPREWHGFLDCLVESIVRNTGVKVCPRCWAFGHALIAQDEARAALEGRG